jgi:hypothetical protein
MKLSDEMYNFNANLSLYIAYNPKDKKNIALNEMIGKWIKKARELEDKDETNYKI